MNKVKLITNQLNKNKKTNWMQMRTRVKNVICLELFSSLFICSIYTFISLASRGQNKLFMTHCCRRGMMCNAESKCVWWEWREPVPSAAVACLSWLVLSGEVIKWTFFWSPWLILLQTTTEEPGVSRASEILWNFQITTLTSCLLL